MRITSFHIDGFGVFQDFGSQQLSPRMVLFYGENEAGKSTLLAFFRAMFFGFSKGKDDANRYPPLRGGAPAGSLSLQLADGASWKLHRSFSGPKRGLETWAESGAVVSEEEFTAAFGGANKEMYRNVYAFSLQELQTLQSLQSDQIKSALYGAAMGSGLRALADAEKTFAAHTADLFGPRAHDRLINRKANELTELRARIQLLAEDENRYADLQRQIRLLDETLKLKQAEHREIDERSRVIARLIKQDDLRQPLELPRIYELSPAREEQLEQLLVVVPTARQHGATLGELTARLADVDAQLKNRLSELGQGWDASRVEKVLSANPELHMVLSFDQRLTALTSDGAHLCELLEQARNELAGREQEAEAIRAQLQNIESSADDDVSPESLERLKTGSEKFAADSRELDSLEAEIARLKQTLEGAADQMRELLGAAELSSGLQDLCNPAMLDSTQSALTIANLVNRSAVLLNKEAVTGADAAVKSAREAISLAQDKLADAEAALRDLKHELHMMPNPGCADAESVERIASDKGRLLELFEKTEVVREDVAELEDGIEELMLLLECSSSIEQMAKLDMTNIRQVADATKEESEAISAQIQQLTVEAESIKLAITRAGAKHQSIRAQVKDLESADASSDGGAIKRLASLNELRRTVNLNKEVAHKVEALKERIADKERSKKALEQTTAENFARHEKVVAAGLMLTGLGAAAYLVIMHHAVPAAACAVVIAIVLSIIMLQFTTSKAPEASKQFGKEIADLQDELQKLNAKQEECSQTLQKLAQELGLPRNFTPSQLDDAENKLKRESDRLSRHQELQSAVEDIQREITKLGDEQRNKEAELDVARSALEDCHKGWRIHLDSIGIGLDKDPDHVMPDLNMLCDRAKALIKLRRSYETDKETLQSILDHNLSAAGVAAPTDRADKEAWVKSVDDWMKANATARDKQAKRSAVATKIADAEKHLAAMKAELAECEAKEVVSLNAQKQARLAWQRWLIAAGLPTMLSCDTALSLADTIADIDEMRGDLRAQLAMQQNFRQSTGTYRAIAGRVPSIGERATDMPAAALMELISRVSVDIEMRRAKQQQQAVVLEKLKVANDGLADLKRRIDALEQQREQNLQDTSRLRNEWRSWLLDRSLDADMSTAAVSKLLPALSTLYLIIAERNQLIRKHSECKKELQQFYDQCKSLFSALNLGGDEKAEEERFDKVIALSEQLLARLSARARALMAEIEGVGGDDGNDHTGLIHQIAALISERDRLAQSSELLVARQQEESLSKELEDLAEEWCRFALAEHLLDRAKQRFEREGQPQVIEVAARLFREMTNGAYSNVSPSVEEPGDFVVETATNKRVESRFLSTGTQEQLYLALRFGFIKHRDAEAEPLPVVMDDILVNFDYRRATLAAESIFQLANTHQVLYFTCHPSSVATFKSIVPDVQLISLSADATAEDAIERLMEKFKAAVTADSSIYKIQS